MSDLARQLREDRTLRDAARELVRADVAHLKADFAAKGIASRTATRLTEGASELLDEAIAVAESNRGVLIALIGAVGLWFARNPLRALFTDVDEAPAPDLPENEDHDDRQ